MAIDWIESSEKMPPEDEVVLGYVWHHYPLSYATFDKVTMCGDGWRNVNESGYPLSEKAEVTHWVFLTPPEEEE